MQPSGSRIKFVLRLVFFSLALLAVLGSPFLQNTSARAVDRPPAQVATTVPGHWQFVNATTFDKFTSPEPGSTWSPSFGDSSNGGTVMKPSMSITTKCAWSLSASSQVLTPGQVLQVDLMINSTVTISGNSSVSGQDSLDVIDFSGTSIASTRDEYGANAGQTVSGQGSGSGSFVVPAGWSGAKKFIQFNCVVGSVGLAYTAWHYAWVEGPPTPIVPATPTLPGAPDVGSSADLVTFLAAAGVAAAVIGALLLLLGLLAILIDRGKTKPKPTGPKKTDPEPPQVSYSLTASPGFVEVYADQPASATFTAMRIPSEGAAMLAPEATIQVIVSDSVAGLAASPTSGSGSLTCTFSAPNPKVCASLDVLAVATVGGVVRARAYVRVRIRPVYALELQWEDPQQPVLQVDGKEALAWAKVTSTPPDPDTPADVLAGQVNVSLLGPNSDWIRQPLAPYIEFEKQWNAICAVRPGASAELAPGNPKLVAEFSSTRQQLKAQLSVELNQELVMGAWVNGKKEADVIYQRKQATPGWDFAEIHAYLHAPDNDTKAIQPPFNIGDGPYIEANPPILDVNDQFELETERGQYVIQVALKDGTDLETCFGETPVDQRKVKVKVFVNDDKGKEIHDFVTYRVRPMVTFCVHAFNDDPSTRVLQHEYREIEFNEEMSLVANADDSLKMAGYFMRTDEFAKTGPDPEKRLDIDGFNGFAWLNPQDGTDFGDPQVDDVNTKDGFLCFSLRSSQPLPATPARLDTAHTLILKLGMRSDAASGFTLESEQVELNLSLQFLRLRLWVVPGVYRHTSDAVAYLDLLPSKEALPSQDICLSTKALAGMTLDFDGFMPHQDTCDNAKMNLLGAGAVRWRLRYCGITWENMPEAAFTVRAGLEDPPDPAWQARTSIQVYQNLSALLNDLADDKALAPEINNPNRENLLPGAATKPGGFSFRPGSKPEDIEANLRELKENYKFAKAWVYILSSMTMPRENMYGPVYNIESWFGGGEKYVCSAMRRKIIEWLERRRFFRKGESAANAIERLEKMNGLDFGHYAIVPAHVWAGIFPAGADRFSEYRALDPWWTQGWLDEWRLPDNLITQAGENGRGAIFKAFNYILIYLVIWFAPALTIDQAITVVRAWLNGESPERIQAIIDNSGFLDWYNQLKVDSDNADAAGKYTLGVGVEEWFKDLIGDLG